MRYTNETDAAESLAILDSARSATEAEIYKAGPWWQAVAFALFPTGQFALPASDFWHLPLTILGVVVPAFAVWCANTDEATPRVQLKASPFFLGSVAILLVVSVGAAWIVVQLRFVRGWEYTPIFALCTWLGGSAIFLTWRAALHSKARQVTER